MAALNPSTHDYIATSLDAVPEAGLEQAALLRLSVHRGAFWFDPTLGSRLHLLAREKDVPRVKKIAIEYAAEALEPLKQDGRVVSVSISANQPKNSTLQLHIVLTKPDRTEVMIDYFVQVGG